MVAQANLLLRDRALVDHIMPQDSRVHFRSWPGSSKSRYILTENIFRYYNQCSAISMPGF